ncbi:MAG: mandelate racemase/muconate lactonizing enzyme family protein [Acidobacteria bacterium]|nr:mandelate racemase/muconate lactonizing enzyme family protein [Acidobacteriota bacterium]
MRIRRIEARAIKLPRDLQAATGTAGSPGALAPGVSRYRWSALYPCLYSTEFETAVVRVETSGGLTGWGEAQAPLAPEVACAIIDRLLAPVLEGEEFDGDPASIERLWDRMYSTMRVRGQTGGFMLDAIAALDIALWDLAGKQAGLPVCRLLSESPKPRVPAYFSGLPAANRPEAARRALEQGFTAFKLFYDTSEPGEFFRAMDTLPPARYAVDALWRHSPPEALVFGRELDRRGALWFEAPLPPEDPVAHGELARALATPVAIGESYRTRFELAPFFREGGVGVLQPDLGRCGITEAMRLAREAAARSIPVVPHLSIAFGPQIAAALHFAAAAPGCELAEYNAQVLEMANRFLAEPVRVEDAHWLPPRGPGLGIEPRQP